MDTIQPEGLQTPVRYVKGVGEKRAEQLAKLGVNTVGDVLMTLPHRYEDRRRLASMSQLESGDFATVAGAIVSCGWIQPRFGKGYFEAVVTDDSALIRCRWFAARWLEDQMRPGDRLVVFGKVSKRKGDTIIQHPDHEIIRSDEEEAGISSLHMGRIVPVYGITEHLPQRIMRRIAWNALQVYAPQAEEILPGETIGRWNLVGFREALTAAHFPESLEDARRARYRLAFDEFLCMQLVLVARKIRAERFITGMSFKPAGALRKRFVESLPFALTGAQVRAMDEIRTDMEKPRPMHRLLQGDVGSGKTVVAASALLDAIECGAQGAVMAPTEILADQHYKTFSQYLAPLGIVIRQLVGSMSEADKIGVRAGIADGRTNLVVGTHALIQDRVAFKNLGLVVIDEQHKFGVEQRGVLYGKGQHPDVLVMTATPIPRTIAMTLYGDLDVSVIDEMPAGRQEIVTRVIKESQLPKAYEFIRQQVGKGRQVYIVYPLVSDSDAVQLKSAEAMYVELKDGALAGLRVGLMHGQMPGDQKDRTMHQFRTGQFDVLVTTTVVEVGVDVANANVMLVENAERFGLAQLHQLRGRVGRGPYKSFCVLESGGGGLDAWKRLKIMEETTDGFRIAEEDFKIRGMGNLLGSEQSGLPSLRVGNPLTDESILKDARKEAFTLIEQDPTFEKPGYEKLRQRARVLYRSVEPFVKVG